MRDMRLGCQSGPSMPISVRVRRAQLCEGYIDGSLARGRIRHFLSFPHHSFSVAHHLLVVKMADKDSDGSQKDVHNDVVRSTSVTEVNLNKNLDAK